MRKTLVSGIAILVAAPAIAAVGDTTFTANQTVANSCVIGVTGVDSGTASTTVQWTTLTYSCAAGTYLPDGDTWTSDSQYTSGNCKQCTAGNYCAGSGNGTFTYSEASDQGITSCGNTYNHSDVGSTSADDCYRDCAAGDVAHLKSGGTVTGRYYSTGTNQCEPANDQQCTTGYHYTAGTGNPDLTTAIGNTAGTGYTANDYAGSESGTSGMSHEAGYNIIGNDPMAFAVDYGDNKGMIKGHGRCSKTGVANIWYSNNNTFASDHFVNNLTDETDPETGGQYCYCHIESYTLNGATQSLSAPWVFDDSFSASYCASVCADICASGLQGVGGNSLAFRAAVFGSLGSPVASCDASQYTVSYACGDGTGTAPVNATATYDSSFSPAANTCTRTGYTFAGWAVSSTNDVKPAETAFTWNYAENKTLTATWTARSITCAAGQYLRASDATCQTCLAGSYCPSASTTYTYNGSDQGLTSCGNTYPNSDVGVTSADNCYRNCSTSDVAHIASGGTVSGRYYSTGTNLCAPADSSQCATGYHYTAGLDLVTAIGVTETGTGYGYKSNNGISVSNMSAFGLTENGTWGTNYGTGKGMVKGKSQCTSQSGTNNSSTWSNPTISQTLPSTRGGYCYCQLTEYTPDGGSAQLLSAPWVYRDNLLGAGNCEDSCATSCAQYMYSSTTSSLAFRNAMLSSVPANPATCDANTISINWKDAFGNTFEMGSCTYDGPITTPTNAPTKRGHTFGGWSFIQ